MNKAQIFFTNVWWTAESVDKPSYEYIADKYDKIDWQYEGYFNIINPQTATVRVKFKVSLEFPTEFNYLIIKNNSLLKQRSYWFIENYRFLSDGMYQISLRRDIWANFNVFDYDNLKDNQLFCKRINIQRYLKNEKNEIIYNQNWGLFLAMDNLGKVNNYLGSEGGYFLTQPRNWPNSVDVSNIWKTYFTKNDATFDKARPLYVYAILTLTDTDIKNLSPSFKIIEAGLPSLIFMAPLPSQEIMIGDETKLRSIEYLNKYLSSTKLQGLFLSPVPFEGSKFGSPIPIRVNDQKEELLSWFSIPINSLNNTTTDSKYFSNASNTYKFRLETSHLSETEGFERPHDYLIKNPPTLADKFNFESEPKIYMSPHREVIVTNFTEKVNVNYEWNWLYNASGFWDCVINPGLEGISYDFRITKTDYKGTDYSNTYRFSIKDRSQIGTLSNAYNNYMQNHINSYNTSMGIANLNQESLVGLATPSGLGLWKQSSVLQDLGPWEISSVLGSITNLFTGSSTKQLAHLRAEVADLHNTPEAIKSRTNLEVVSLINILNDVELDKEKITPSDGIVYLSNFPYMIKKPSKGLQEKIAYHYHMNGYNVEDIPLTKDDLFTRHNFNFFMVDNLLQVWDVEEVLYQPWIYNYFQKLFQEGVRIWTKAHFDDGNKPLDYSVANWEEVLID